MKAKKNKKRGNYFFVFASIVALVFCGFIFLNFKYGLEIFLANKNFSASSAVSNLSAFTNFAPDPLVEKSDDFYKNYIREHNAYLGSGDMPVIIFCDFTLPNCKNVWQTVLKIRNERQDLLKDKIVLAWKNFVISTNPISKLSAKAVLCAKEQDKFWEYGDLLFANQEQISEKNIIKFAGELDLEIDKFEACLKAENALLLVGYDIDDAQKLYIDGLPYILIGSQRLEKDNYNQFEQVIMSIK